MGRTARIGHNSQRASEPTEVANWRDEHAALFRRADDLLTAFSRFEARHGNGIEGAEVAQHATAFAAQLGHAAETIEGVRKALKAPLLDMSRALDRSFKTETSDRLAAAAARVTGLIGGYQRRLAERDRHERERLAELARAEADRMAEAASLSGDATSAEAARAMDDAAQRAEARAVAESQRHARVVSEDGATASLQEHWVFEVTALEKVPLEYLIVDERKVRAAIKGPHGLRDIPGLRIFDATKTVIK